MARIAAGPLAAALVGGALALGADWVNSARGFMFALGCVQSLHCHDNRCPTGIATQDKGRQSGLVVPDKAQRVANFHRNTVRALGDLVGAAGCLHPSELTPRHLQLRLSEQRSISAVKTYDLLERGQLLADPDSTQMAVSWRMARADSFQPAEG